jgi:hypothetical protein
MQKNKAIRPVAPEAYLLYGLSRGLPQVLRSTARMRMVLPPRTDLSQMPVAGASRGRCTKKAPTMTRIPMTVNGIDHARRPATAELHCAT